MKLIVLTSFLILKACSLEDAGKFSNMDAARQALSPNLMGSYSFSKGCETDHTLSNTITIVKDSVSFENTVCDVKSLKVSKDPIGTRAFLENCWSNGDEVKAFSIFIEAKDTDTIILHGLGKQPRPIYAC